MGTETIKYSQLGLQDIRFGTGTFEITLADGRKVVLNEVDIGDILSDATKSTRVVTLDTLTVTTLNFSGTLSGAALSISGAATFGSLSTASATITSTPTARTHALTVGNVQDGLGVYVASVGGTADAITLSPSPAITAYAAGQTFRFVTSLTNTTAVTVAVSGLTAQAITKNGTDALIAGDLPQGAMVEITYYGMRFIIGTVGAATGAAGAVVLTTVTTKGDLIVATADETVTRLAIGANGTIPMARSVATTGLAYVAALNKHIYGFTYTNGTDATNDLDIAAGGAMDSTGAYFMVGSALTKQSDAAWAVGTAAGMLDTGAVGNSDYYLYAIARSDSGVVDYICSLAAPATGPAMPTNYDFFRAIGWFKRVGGTIVAFTTYEMSGGGLGLHWTTSTTDINPTNTLTTTRRTDAVKVPLNFSVLAHLTVDIYDAAASVQAWVYCPDQSDQATGSPTANFDGLTTKRALGPLRVRTSATGTIAARANIATVDSYAV